MPLTVQLSLNPKARERIQSWREEGNRPSVAEQRLEEKIRELISAALPSGQSIAKVDLRPARDRDRHLVVAVHGAQDKERLCGAITAALDGIPAYEFRLLHGAPVEVPLLLDSTECS